MEDHILERKIVKLHSQLASCAEFDGCDVLDFATHLTNTVAELKLQHPEAPQVLYEYDYDGSYYITVWGEETDEIYNKRLADYQNKIDQERQRDLATLKKLQAKYPDVKFEM